MGAGGAGRQPVAPFHFPLQQAPLHSPGVRHSCLLPEVGLTVTSSCHVGCLLSCTGQRPQTTMAIKGWVLKVRLGFRGRAGAWLLSTSPGLSWPPPPPGPQLPPNAPRCFSARPQPDTHTPGSRQEGETVPLLS